MVTTKNVSCGVASEVVPGQMGLPTQSLDLVPRMKESGHGDRTHYIRHHHD
jgi:hypothetical protein